MTTPAPKSAETKDTTGHQHAQSAPVGEEEQYAPIDALPDLRLVHADPRILSPSAVLHLQRTLGNQMVQRLLINREEAPAEAPETDAAAPVSDEDLIEIFGEFLADIPTPEVPTYEVIAGTTGAQTSRGRGSVEGPAVARWRRERIPFTEGAREAASSEPPRGQAIPTQSPNLPVASGQAYDHRWALTFFAWDYQEGAGDDLPIVRQNLRAGSPFRSALDDGEFGNTIEVENPTAAAVVDRINLAILELTMNALEPGQIAELVITFSGHGGNGDMIGVDGERVSLYQLHDIAESARSNGVHIVYIMDICFAGNAVNMAQQTATADLRERVNAMSGDEAASLGQALQGVDDLLFDLWEINNSAYHLAQANRVSGRPDVPARLEETRNAVRYMLGHFHPLRELSYLESGEFLELIQHHASATVSGAPSLTSTQEGVNRYLRYVAALVDATNDHVNRTIQQINARVNGTSGEGAGGGGPGEVEATSE